jgi:hypothetical protein
MRELLPALPWELIHAYNTPAHASVTTFEFDSPLPWLMLVTFEPDSSVGTVAHEVFHLTHRVMEFTRAEFSHEPYAYLYQWLFRTILMITHEHPDPECLIATEDKDAGNITWLNTEHDLGLTPLSVLNKTIEEHLQQTTNHQPPSPIRKCNMSNNTSETNKPSVWSRIRTTCLNTSEHRAFMFACSAFFVILTRVIRHPEGLLDANRHAFSGCLGDPSTLALFMDAFGYYLAVSVKAVFFSIFFTAFAGVVFFVLDSCVSNAVGFCKGTADLCVYAYKNVTTPSQKRKRPVVTSYDIETKPRSLLTRIRDRVLCSTAWVIERMWFMVLMNFLVSVLAAGIMYVISAPKVCYAQSTLGYSIGIYCVLFIGLMFVPIQVVLSMSFNDYTKHRNIRERMSFLVASAYTRAHMVDHSLTRSYMPEPRSTEQYGFYYSLCIENLDDHMVVLRWYRPLALIKDTKYNCPAQLFVTLDAWNSVLRFVVDPAYPYTGEFTEKTVNVHDITTEQLFQIMHEFQDAVDRLHRAYIEEQAMAEEADTYVDPDEEDAESDDDEDDSETDSETTESA